MIGSLVYLFLHVIRKRDIENVQEGVITVLDPSKKIKVLEKQLHFSETFENRVALADELMRSHAWQQAIEHYKAALKDMFKNDFYVHTRLQEAFFKLNDYEASLSYANAIMEQADFKQSDAHFLYAMALDKMGRSDEAERQLLFFDAPYNYYPQRLELARLFRRRHKNEKALEVYKEMVKESENMSKQSYKANKNVLQIARQELSEMN